MDVINLDMIQKCHLNVCKNNQSEVYDPAVQFSFLGSTIPFALLQFFRQPAISSFREEKKKLTCEKKSWRYKMNNNS